MLARNSKREYLKAKIWKTPLDGSGQQDGQERARYQWFWEGTQKETEILTPDLKHTVKRHVVVKRVVSIAEFPVERVKQAKAALRAAKERTATDSNILRGVEDAEEEQSTLSRQTRPPPKSLEDLLDFSFYIQVRQYTPLSIHPGSPRSHSWKVRVKRRYGRLHRIFLLSGNKTKASFLRPMCTQEFRINPLPIAVPNLEHPDGPTPPGGPPLPDSPAEPDGPPQPENSLNTIHLENVGSIPLHDTSNLQDMLRYIKRHVSHLLCELKNRPVCAYISSMMETGMSSKVENFSTFFKT
jgi:hypothetical protein